MMTLTRICQGGIYDHVGGGFARYSTDHAWLAPHFEKMLYDNAQLIDLMTLVWQEEHTPLFAARVAETIDWLTREMIGENGAFAASLDADSEGEEGKFYVWSETEIDRAAGQRRGVFQERNLRRPARRQLGRPYHSQSHSRASGRRPRPMKRAWRRRAKFFSAARESRIRPGRDDKVLADWNGLDHRRRLAHAGAAFRQSRRGSISPRMFSPPSSKP